MSKGTIEDMIGEVVGLRALLKAVVVRSAAQSGEAEKVFKELHELSHRILQKGGVDSPGLDSEAIRARSEHVIDQMLGTIRVTTRSATRDEAPSPDRHR